MAGGGNESIFMVVNATTDTDPDLWEVGRQDSREFTIRGRWLRMEHRTDTASHNIARSSGIYNQWTR